MKSRHDILVDRVKTVLKFKAHVKASGLDPAVYARQYGYAPSQLTRWFSGENLPGPRMMRKIKRALKK